MVGMPYRSVAAVSHSHVVGLQKIDRDLALKPDMFEQNRESYVGVI
jgi:hypothetical protein